MPREAAEVCPLRAGDIVRDAANKRYVVQMLPYKTWDGQHAHGLHIAALDRPGHVVAEPVFIGDCNIVLTRVSDGAVFRYDYRSLGHPTSQPPSDRRAGFEQYFDWPVCGPVP